MAKHRVVMELPPRELNRADAQFAVEQDGRRLGTLRVSNGSLVWFPHGTQYGYKLGWTAFHSLMREHASRSERR